MDVLSEPRPQAPPAVLAFVQTMTPKQDPRMAGPLSGYRILDATQMVSGPMAVMILGDQGADVIKIEPTTTGDLTRALGGRRAGISPVQAGIVAIPEARRPRSPTR